ncbi:MAG: hypothetical protein AB7O62_11950 [Pirellulales bacterium]
MPSQTDQQDRTRRWESVTDEMAQVLRQKTGAERLAIANGMWRFAFQLVSLSVKNQHPTWTEDLIRQEIARRMSHGAI